MVFIIYLKDFSKFDGELSQDLYKFYNEIIRAESNREYIQSYYSEHPTEKLKDPYFGAYMEMRSNIMNAAILVPKITSELKGASA